MAWVSPRVYSILSKSEEGKDIIEQLPDLTQDECQEELESFFGEGGKGASSSNEYSQAKMDDEAEEERYKSMSGEDYEHPSGPRDGEEPHKEDFRRKEEEKRMADDNKGLSKEQIKQTDHIVDYFKAWGKPSKSELQDVVNFYRLTKPMANKVFKSLGIDEEYTRNLEYKEG